MSGKVKECYCRHCGTKFIGYSNSEYCSAECRRKADMLRKKAARRKRRIIAGVRARASDGMAVNDVLTWIRKHYEETGVLLSYGKAVAKIDAEKAVRSDG